jgi:hypothetical protein
MALLFSKVRFKWEYRVQVDYGKLPAILEALTWKDENCLWRNVRNTETGLHCKISQILTHKKIKQVFLIDIIKWRLSLLHYSA